MRDWTERFSLTDRTALVTGASKGIGFEICAVLADAGANVIATGRDASGLEAASERVRKLGRECHTFQCDLADPSAITRLATEVSRDIGTVDILVNNAGIAKTAFVLDMDIADWDETMAVNLRAPLLLSKLLAPGMIKQRWGKIINISSQAAMLAFDEHTAYSASKAALNAMTRGLMREWAQHNIQVNSVCPTIVLTAMGKEVWSAETKSAPMLKRTPLGRFGEPIEVADMVLYLASPASALVNGESLMIDGGFTAA